KGIGPSVQEELRSLGIMTFNSMISRGRTRVTWSTSSRPRCPSRRRVYAVGPRWPANGQRLEIEGGGLTAGGLGRRRPHANVVGITLAVPVRVFPGSRGWRHFRDDWRPLD